MQSYFFYFTDHTSNCFWLLYIFACSTSFVTNSVPSRLAAVVMWLVLGVSWFESWPEHRIYWGFSVVFLTSLREVARYSIKFCHFQFILLLHPLIWYYLYSLLYGAIKLWKKETCLIYYATVNSSNNCFLKTGYFNTINSQPGDLCAFVGIYNWLQYSILISNFGINSHTEFVLSSSIW